jgi:uncharacterized protein YkwD
VTSLTAVAAGAAIAGGATILNGAPARHGALDVPLVMGYNDPDNRVRQTDSDRPASLATVLSGPAATSSSTPSSSLSSASSSSSATTSGSAPSESQAPDPPPPPRPPSAEPTKAPSPGSPDASAAAEVVIQVNQYRGQFGCDALTVDSQLTAAAQEHSTDMANRKYLSHNTPEGATFDQRIRTAGYPKPAAENIAQGPRSADLVMASWMRSQGDRENILNCRYKTIGVAVDTNGWYWTQDFGF